MMLSLIFLSARRRGKKNESDQRPFLCLLYFPLHFLSFLATFNPLSR